MCGESFLIRDETVWGRQSLAKSTDGTSVKLRNVCHDDNNIMALRMNGML